MSAAPNAAAIEALRAGREASSSMRDLYAGVPSEALVAALCDDDAGVGVGEEFAMVRALRDRGLTPEGQRRPSARGGR